MIHKTWPDMVIVRQEGSFWQICRLERRQNRKDVVDVLQTELSREACEAALVRRGYAAVNDEADTWLRCPQHDAVRSQPGDRVRASAPKRRRPRTPADREGPICSLNEW
jgi:hypothetical protein